MSLPNNLGELENQLTANLAHQQQIFGQQQQMVAVNAQSLAAIQSLMKKKDEFEKSKGIQEFRYNYGYGAFRVAELHDMENGLPAIPVDVTERPSLDQLHSVKYPGDNHLITRTVPAFISIYARLTGGKPTFPITQGLSDEECEYFLRTDLKKTFVNARMRLIGVDELFDNVFIARSPVGIMFGITDGSTAKLKTYTLIGGDYTISYNHRGCHPNTRAPLLGIDYLASFVNTDVLKALYGIQNVPPQGIRVKYSLE